MSSAADPTFPISKFTPGPGDPHNVVHPFVDPGPDQGQPFTLLTNPPPPDDLYSIGFNYYDWRGGGMEPVRVYLAAFTSSVSSPTWWHSLAIHSSEVKRVRIPKVELNGGTNLWVGAWWDDGTYPNTPQGVTDYFAAHPSGGIHHTVPIVIG